MTDHGPQYDTFRGGARDPHGPQHDEFASGGGASTAHGAQHDEFTRRVTAGTGKHGALWDDFGWMAMPAMHGQNFDNDFDQPAALDGGEHGTWHDVFRGGTNVRYLYGGQDLEGVVLNAGKDHVIVQPRGGGRHEVGLGQIKELRYATDQGQAGLNVKPVAKPGHTQGTSPRSSAEAPSAHSATAHGGGRTPVELPSESKVLNAGKDAVDELDVAKLAPGTYHSPSSPCPNCDSHHVNVSPIKGGGAHYVSCASCGEDHGLHSAMPKDLKRVRKDAPADVDVAKTLDELRALAAEG